MLAGESGTAPPSRWGLLGVGETQARLRSRCPFVEGTFCRLLCPVGRRPAGWLGCGRWSGNHPPAGCLCIASPCRSSPGSGLPRQTWVGLDGLRAGVGRFGIGVWGEACPGVQPAAAGWAGGWHKVPHEVKCPLYRQPNGLYGLIDDM